MKTSSLHRQSGLNLIEILVAALILSIGLLSLAGLQVASLKSVQNATQKQQASFIIHELLERMRSNRDAALSGSYNTAGISCSPRPKDCAQIDACSVTEVATYDLFSLQCGNNSSDAINSGVVAQLLNGSLSVACMGGGAKCTNGVIVTLSWTERLASKEIVAQDGKDSAKNADTEDFTLSVDAVI